MIRVVIGGQFGSEGKGSVVSWLARRYPLDLSIRIGSPNAGHTFMTPGGATYKMRQLPSTWAFSDAPIYLPAGAVLDREVLLTELEVLHKNGYKGEVYISPQAVVINEGHREQEKTITTGSTYSGTGAARASKCIRQAKLAWECSELAPYTRQPLIEAILADPNNSLLIETTQGFGLSLDSSYYPYCTSTNIDIYRALSDAEVPFGVHTIRPLLVLRTFPIRIAGNSGPLLQETNWQSLRDLYGDHIPDEKSTVTGNTRRAGEWDSKLARDALGRTQPSQVFLTFVDYIFPQITKTGITKEVDTWLHFLEGSMSRKIDWIGVGPGVFLPREVT